MVSSKQKEQYWAEIASLWHPRWSFTQFEYFVALFCEVVERQIVFSLYRRPPCQTLSKAWVTSRNIAELYLLASNSWLIFWTSLWTCKIVECFWRKLNWYSGMILLLKDEKNTLKRTRKESVERHMDGPDLGNFERGQSNKKECTESSTQVTRAKEIWRYINLSRYRFSKPSPMAESHGINSLTLWSFKDPTSTTQKYGVLKSYQNNNNTILTALTSVCSCTLQASLFGTKPILRQIKFYWTKSILSKKENYKTVRICFSYIITCTHD